MTSKERVRTALRHEEPDRVPIGFGGSAVTGMHVTAVEKLRRHYGLEDRPVKVCEPYQMLGEIEEDLLDAIGIDVVPLSAPSTLFGFRNENWKPFRLPWGQEVLVSEHFNTTEDTNGDLLIYPEGDLCAPPSGRMPASGYFFDTIIRQQPFEEEDLDSNDNLEEFGLLSEDDIRYFRTEAERLAGSDRAVLGTIPGAGLGDIALVPAPFLKHPKGIRDVSEWYISTVSRQDYVHAIFDKQTEIALANLKTIYDTTGDVIDVAFICGTDFGTQSSQFCSAETFETLYAPYYRRVNDWVHANTRWKTFKHSCGAAEPLLSHFIDCGFDIFNPVQCSAAGMEPRGLKANYGNDLVFWGGGVDTQKTLPFGTPEQVRAEVLERCEIFAAGGGYVFNAIHNVQAQTPTENIVAMIEAAREFRRE